MKMKALRGAMEKYGEALVIEIVQQLKNADKEATGKLARSIGYELFETLDSIAVGIVAEPYFEFVDGGRRKGAKPPPSGAILAWMKVRNIKGRNKKTGKFITQKSAAFLIARSIGKNGIKPAFIIKKSLRNLKSLQAKLLTDAAVEDMTNMISAIFLVK
jgi:hypothetical protein